MVEIYSNQAWSERQR